MVDVIVPNVQTKTLHYLENVIMVIIKKIYILLRGMSVEQKMENCWTMNNR